MSDETGAAARGTCPIPDNPMLADVARAMQAAEACATGGRTLASKALVERLDVVDAAALGIDLAHLAYTALAELSTATEKARRDAPAIAVCDVA